MKKKGSTSDFAASRNAELRRAFFDQGEYSTSDEVMERLVRRPSSRFWVDPYRARDIVSRYQRDPRSIEGMLPRRRAMYIALSERYDEMRELHPGKSMVECMTMAVYSGAPEFYLSPARARDILYS